MVRVQRSADNFVVVLPCSCEWWALNPRHQVEHLNSEEKATMYDLLAYIKHLDGESKAALECLGQAEDLRKSEHNDQSEIRRLVTWGNYAWIYYHMGRQLL